jgi:uncharacterized protein YwgA
MIEDLKKVVACLKHIGLKEVDIQDYAWRFFIQKMISLAQAMGFSTNYSFTVYIKGPYSRDLARDYYQFAAQVNCLATDYQLSREEEEIVDRIEETVFDGIKTRDDINGRMQLLESVSTAMHITRSCPTLSEGEILSLVKSLKPYLDDHQIVIGINKTKALSFRAEYLTDEVRREIAAWDKIDK